MYPDTETRNPLGGICPHDCRYCYTKCWPINLSNKYKGGLFIDEKELNRIKESNKVIFICSCNDLFADTVPREFIERIIRKCQEFPSNTYLFQTKNPIRLRTFFFPINSILGTTIETNRSYNFSKAPDTHLRYESMVMLPRIHDTMVNIEPIMDFDLETMVRWMKLIGPNYISIGANSKKIVKLPEPSPEKVRKLVTELEKITEVRIKDNLKERGLI